MNKFKVGDIVKQHGVYGYKQIIIRQIDVPNRMYLCVCIDINRPWIITKDKEVYYSLNESSECINGSHEWKFYLSNTCAFHYCSTCDNRNLAVA